MFNRCLLKPARGKEWSTNTLALVGDSITEIVSVFFAFGVVHVWIILCELQRGRVGCEEQKVRLSGV